MQQKLCPRCLRKYHYGTCDNPIDTEILHLPNTSVVGKHPWADTTGNITPRSAGEYVANMILSAGAMASTAFRCAHEISKDIEDHPEQYKTKS